MSESMSFIPFDYPREVLELSAMEGGLGYRRIVKNAQELEQYWRGKNGSGNVYFTAYGYSSTQAPKHHRVDYDTPLIHHFVMDFDCKDFKAKGAEVPFSVPRAEVIRLHQFLLKDDTKHFVWFSGGGYHVWIPLSESLKPTKGSAVSHIKHSGRTLLNKWDRLLNLRCNDPTVAFDTAGMIRIPNSYNARRGCWMIPLSSDEITSLDYEDLMRIAQNPREGVVQLGEKPLKFEVHKRTTMTMGDIKEIDVPTVSLNNIHVLPCLVQAAMGGGNPIHRARVHFATYLADRLRFFFPHYHISKDEKGRHVQQISSICKEQGWVDYKPEKTEQQVRSIVEKGYTHAKCSTLYSEGFCIGKCKYYDNSMGD